MDSKTHILDILKHADQVVSGETLSAELGISRVAIWKHIRNLIQAGVPIVSSPKGYRLENDPDSLHSSGFGARQALIHYLHETTSTMDDAAELARRGCPAFSVVVAERQTRGRGRMQRVWLSQDGGLYFTVVVRPEIPVVQAGMANLAAAVDLADVLRTDYRIDAGLKWPNDILVDNRKLCGILSQMQAEGEQVGYVTVGIGLNVNNSPETGESNAVSMQSLVGGPVPRRKILEAFLDRFEKRMAAFDPQVVMAQWKALNVTLGQTVMVLTIKEKIEGIAEDVDALGGLMVRQTDGTLKTVMVGDCFHNRKG